MCIQPVRSLSAAVAMWSASILPVAPAHADDFVVKAGGDNRIQFISDAPLEKITGASGRVEGRITVDPEDLESARGRLVVPVASLRTNNELRDEHLQGDGWLDAEKHPSAVFELTGIEGANRLTPHVLTTVKVHGKFTVHGVTRPVVATAKVRWMPDAQLNVNASFTVKLTHHRISVPQLVRLKVSDDIVVNVTLRARAQ